MAAGLHLFWGARACFSWALRGFGEDFGCGVLGDRGLCMFAVSVVCIRRMMA